MKKIVKYLSQDLAAILLGISLAFAFSPYNIFPLAIISPAGLLALWYKKSAKRAAWLGFVFGLGLFATGVYWIYISVNEFGGLPPIAAGMMTAAFVAILSSFPSITGYLLNRFYSPYDSTTIILAFPAIWVMIEWVRSWIYTGFPWLFIGYSQVNSPIIGYAPIFSVYGVSLAALISSALIFYAALSFRRKNYFALYKSLFGILIIWIVGAMLSLISWTSPNGNPVNVSLVQGNVPQTLKWSPEHIALSLERYRDLTLPLLKKDNIVIWPEAAIPLPLQDAAEYIEELDEKARAAGAHIIFGIPIQAEGTNSYYNAVASLGEDKHVYLKRRLVPFGEYVPFTAVFASLFDFMHIPMSNLIPGHYLQKPMQIASHKIFVSICYEIAFPELSKNQASDMGFILTVTNDAWFGESSAQAQHLQMAQMRAIELRRPLLFVTNDGITAIIDPNGAIKATIAPHETAILNDSIQPMAGLTLWMRYGMDPILAVLLAMLLASAFVRYILRQNKGLETHDGKTVQPPKD